MRANPLDYLGFQVADWKQAGTYNKLRILQGPSAAESHFDGKDVVNLASNNYLGLTTHPKLMEAAILATRKYGAGSGAVRTISGTMGASYAPRRAHRKIQKRGSVRRFFNPASPLTRGRYRPF